MRSFGVDEAGKGPVLGPMVAACVVGPPSSVPDEIDDSKRIPPDRREELAAAIQEHEALSVGIATVEVHRIDDPATDMTSLTVTAHADAIADAAVTTLEGTVDAGEVDAHRFGRRVATACADRDVAVTARHGADESNDLVSAASVIAKVERDTAIAEIAAAYGDIGSGYPADPRTRQFLADFVRESGALPDCARRTWQTSRDVLAAAEQGTLTDF